MNKSDLVREVARRRAAPSGDTGRIVEELLAAIGRALSDGHRVQLRRFGAFDLRVRRSRTMRNPRTGEPYRVPGKLVPVFRAAPGLTQRVVAGMDAGRDAVGGADVGE